MYHTPHGCHMVCDLCVSWLACLAWFWPHAEIVCAVWLDVWWVVLLSGVKCHAIVLACAESKCQYIYIYIDKYNNYMSLNYVHKFYRLISIGRDEEMKRWREGQNFNSCHWSYTSTSVWHVLSFAFLVLSSHVWQCPLSYHDYFPFTLSLHRKSSCTSSWWKSQAKLGSAQRSGRGRASCSIIDS